MKEKDFKLESKIESILLVAEKPITAKEIAAATGEMLALVQTGLKNLIFFYEKRGIKIIRKGDYYSMVTAPENADCISRFLNEELRHDLSEAALEALSIVTYKQPITRIEIEEIRGVNSDHLVRNLMIRGLITEVGRKDTPGRPILYGTTMEFLQYFGLEGEHELPEMKDTDEGELFKNIDGIETKK